MKKKTKTILLIILCAVVITVAYIAAFGDYSTINSQLGEYYGMLKNSDSKDIVASYKDKNITLKVLEYQRGLNEMKMQSYQSVNTDSLPDYMKYKSESDRDIINRLIIGMILVEEAEKMGLVPTEEETAEWVAVQKRGYEEVTEMAQIIDEYCMGAGITVEEYWADIEEQSYETCTHLRMRNHFKVRYLKEHGIDENELGGENMQNYLAAYEEYRSGLLEAHKDDIVYYNDGNQEVAAEYNGKKILMSSVTYEKNTSLLRNETGSVDRANDREIVDRIIENMIMIEEAEKLGLSATQIEIDDMVEMTKKAYDLPEGKKMMDEFFTTAEMTLEEYLGIIREQAPRVIARQKLRNMIAQEYCEEHGIKFTKVNQPDDVVEAINAYIAKLLETHKSEIVYYVD